jgi:beta-1,4-galactosyltransferase 1
MNKNTILIPYRNREEHLNYFIENSVPLLEKHLDGFKCFIIEQSKDNQPFNRGKLLNVGFKEFDSEYYITHDVDLYPKKETTSLYKLVENDITRIFNGHNKSLGGVTKFKKSSFSKVNGFPNYIWGWGIEDRAIYYRSVVLGIKTSQNYTNMSNFNFGTHKRNNSGGYKGEMKKISQREDMFFNNFNEKEQYNHIMKSGVNNLNYKVIKRIYISDNIEKIIVNI